MRTEPCEVDGVPQKGLHSPSVPCFVFTFLELPSSDAADSCVSGSFETKLLFIWNADVVYFQKRDFSDLLFLGKLEVFVAGSAEAELSAVPADQLSDALEMFSLHQKSQQHFQHKHSVCFSCEKPQNSEQIPSCFQPVGQTEAAL